MSIKEQDIKLLWGRAGGLCNICKMKLSEDKAKSSDAYPFGEQAHIIGEKEDGPRGKSPLTLAERNSYHNLILLCPTDHTKVDKDVGAYPVERLHMLKAEHELWLEKTRTAADARKTAEAAVYASLIDAAAEKCMLEDWRSWMSYTLSTSPTWKKDWVNKIDDFRMLVLRAVWPGTLPELERALKTLAMTIQRAAHVFLEHAEPHEDAWVEIRFYREARGDRDEYDRLLGLYNAWISEQDRLLFDSTKCANWVAEVVRRDVNPMFFATAGKFMLSYGPNMTGSYTFSAPEYTQEEKNQQPGKIMAELEALREEERRREKEMWG